MPDCWSRVIIFSNYALISYFLKYNQYSNLTLSLTDKHLIEIEVIGPYNEELKQNFHVLTVRSNPAIVGHVTGMQTYASFFNSLLETLDDYNRFGIKVCWIIIYINAFKGKNNKPTKKHSNIKT
jgi:hypothetical protein